MVTPGKQWSISHIRQGWGKEGRRAKARGSLLPAPWDERATLPWFCVIRAEVRKVANPRVLRLIGHGIHPIIILNGKSEFPWCGVTGRPWTEGSLQAHLGPGVGFSAPGVRAIQEPLLRTVAASTPPPPGRPPELPKACVQATSFPTEDDAHRPQFSRRSLILLLPRSGWFFKCVSVRYSQTCHVRTFTDEGTVLWQSVSVSASKCHGRSTVRTWSLSCSPALGRDLDLVAVATGQRSSLTVDPLPIMSPFAL